MHTYEFKSVDTWFFKQALAPDALSAQEYSSDFPPSARTMIGALRSAIGESQAVNWAAYRRGDDPAMETMIGRATEAVPPGAFFSGPWISVNQQRYFPAPLHWPAVRTGNNYDFTRLSPRKDAIHCDLGRIRLPQPEQRLPHKKLVSGLWLSRRALETLLCSKNESETIAADQVLHPQDDHVVTEEPRLGIARNNAARRVIDGMLYQTRHLRMRADAALELDCTGWQPPASVQTQMTFGGEARLASITQRDYQPGNCPQWNGSQIPSRFSLTLLTPAHFTSGGWCPDGFSMAGSEAETQFWEGQIGGISLRLVSAVVGNPLRSGGWNMAQSMARAVVSLAPAGSTYFFETLEECIPTEQLNRLRLGQHPELGLGQCALGTW
ncbi:type III-B CRISPR module-associated Cmr3 family protein [Teredinibacter turnerae]|uniref:type III-B CRISPR module-associated Cmr3 family protein n=1 Tax=Teredinibacter turnerae TaxID=2426 RepID=UPI00040E59AE|nr:type III-B CRISPR module-associated Cmr3 family protein [Teredinibacter turnerae]